MEAEPSPCDSTQDQTMLGTFWGISAGPGSSDWLTLQAVQQLQAATVIALPQGRLGNPGIAHGIVQPYLKPQQIVLPLHLPFVQDQQQLQTAWEQAAQCLYTFLSQGHTVAFVSEGDVNLYSTFTYLAHFLQRLDARIPIHIVPGVCSPLAAAAALQFPLAIGAEKLAILPAMYTVEELETVTAWADVVVLMKVAPVFAKVWQWLQQKNLLDQACLVEWVGHSQQQLFTSLQDLEAHQPAYFSLLIFRLVRLEDKDPFRLFHPSGHD